MLAPHNSTELYSWSQASCLHFRSMAILRLFGYGNRVSPHHGLSTDYQFQASVLRPLCRRVLASMAHFALDLVSRLHVHFLGWQSRCGTSFLFQHSDHFHCFRPLARCELDLCDLGISPWFVSVVFSLDRACTSSITEKSGFGEVSKGACLFSGHQDLRFSLLRLDFFPCLLASGCPICLAAYL